LPVLLHSTAPFNSTVKVATARFILQVNGKQFADIHETRQKDVTENYKTVIFTDITLKNVQTRYGAAPAKLTSR